MPPFSKSSTSKPLTKKTSTIDRPTFADATNSVYVRYARTGSFKVNHLPSSPFYTVPSSSSSSHRDSFGVTSKVYQTPHLKITSGHHYEDTSEGSSSFFTASTEQDPNNRNVADYTNSLSCPINRPGTSSVSLCTDKQIFRKDIVQGSKIKADTAEEEYKQSTTPPVQESVSPEIGGSSSVLSAIVDAAAYSVTPYGAGHLLSGITDKRKCRPTGVLVFEEIKNADTETTSFGTPSPVRASMHWLESPSSNAWEDSPKSSHNENLMQTPDSDGDPHRNPTTSWHGFGFTTQDLKFPEAPEVIEHGSSYQYDVSTESSSCVEYLRLQKVFEDMSIKVSSSCDPNSPKKISWKDGIGSGEGDDFECCRCFSDAEENEFKDPIKNGLESDNGSESDASPMIVKTCEMRYNVNTASEIRCTESISSDAL